MARLEEWCTTGRIAYPEEEVAYQAPITKDASRFAREVADRVVFMADGQIVEVGTPEHFFENPQEDRTKEFLSQIL